MKECINEWFWKNGVSLFAGAPQQELRADLKSLNPFLGWKVTLNIIWSGLEWLFLYPGKIGFASQRLLWTSKGSNGLQLGLKRGLRLDSVCMEQNFFFLGIEICKRRFGNGHLSP
jgi:hypothetical protein